MTREDAKLIKECRVVYCNNCGETGQISIKDRAFECDEIATCCFRPDYYTFLFPGDRFVPPGVEIE